jgi:hypothetical protein
MNGVIHPGCHRVTINVGIIYSLELESLVDLGIIVYRWNVSWLAVDDPHTIKM